MFVEEVSDDLVMEIEVCLVYWVVEIGKLVEYGWIFYEVFKVWFGKVRVIICIGECMFYVNIIFVSGVLF